MVIGVEECGNCGKGNVCNWGKRNGNWSKGNVCSWGFVIGGKRNVIIGVM